MAVLVEYNQNRWPPGWAATCFELPGIKHPRSQRGFPVGQQVKTARMTMSVVENEIGHQVSGRKTGFKYLP
jgi:hypothetical protein